MYHKQQQNQAQTKQKPQENQLISLLQSLSNHERSLLGSLVFLAAKYNFVYPGTDLLQKYGAGCRDTQIKSRARLISLGLINQVHERKLKGTKFNRTNFYMVARWLLDESLAFIVRNLCKIPWYAPIRDIQLVLSGKPSGKEVDSILKDKDLFINPPVPFLSKIYSNSPLTDAPSCPSREKTSSMIANGTRTVRDGACKNKQVGGRIPDREKNLKREMLEHMNNEQVTFVHQTPEQELKAKYADVLTMRPLFTGEESTLLQGARLFFTVLFPKMKRTRVQLGMVPFTAEEEESKIQKQLEVLTAEELQTLKNEGLI